MDGHRTWRWVKPAGLGCSFSLYLSNYFKLQGRRCSFFPHKFIHTNAINEQSKRKYSAFKVRNKFCLFTLWMLPKCHQNATKMLLIHFDPPVFKLSLHRLTRSNTLSSYQWDFLLTLAKFLKIYAVPKWKHFLAVQFSVTLHVQEVILCTPAKRQMD